MNIRRYYVTCIIIREVQQEQSWSAEFTVAKLHCAIAFDVFLVVKKEQMFAKSLKCLANNNKSNIFFKFRSERKITCELCMYISVSPSHDAL